MRINVAYGVDEQFTRYTYLSTFSILKNMDKNNTLHCYLITTIPNKYILNIKNLENIFTNFELNIISVNGGVFDKIPVHGEIEYLNNSAYYRFGINLINGVERIIYLDSDTIIDDDISVLFQEDLDNKIIGACSDMPKNYIARYIDTLPLKRKMYFNSGMLLVDLNKRKEHKISQKCINLLNKQTYKFADQDPLNIILQDDCKWLPGKYNVQTGYFFLNNEEFKNIGFNKKYYSDAISHPIIVHFAGSEKPWKILNYHPFGKIYHKIRLSSLMVWKGKVSVMEYFTYIIYQIESLFTSNIRMKIQNIAQYIYKIYIKIKEFFYIKAGKQNGKKTKNKDICSTS